MIDADFILFPMGGTIRLLYPRIIVGFAFYFLRDALAGQLRPIRLQGYIPMTGEGWSGGKACLVATLMAVRHVNERSGLLNGYSINYSWTDSKVMNQIYVYVLYFVVGI